MGGQGWVVGMRHCRWWSEFGRTKQVNRDKAVR